MGNDDQQTPDNINFIKTVALSYCVATKMEGEKGLPMTTDATIHHELRDGTISGCRLFYFLSTIWYTYAGRTITFSIADINR